MKSAKEKYFDSKNAAIDAEIAKGWPEFNPKHAQTRISTRNVGSNVQLTLTHWAMDDIVRASINWGRWEGPDFVTLNYGAFINCWTYAFQEGQDPEKKMDEFVQYLRSTERLKI